MPMNKVQKASQMYPWCTHTINFIKGTCEYDCLYCYIKTIVKRFGIKQKPPYLDEKELDTNLGKDNIIFVGSSIDMFAKGIPKLWIELILQHCRRHDNTYLFQSKNPGRFMEFIEPVNKFPKKTILGTTLESDIDHKISKAPSPTIRMNDMVQIPADFKKMVSIEPIMDFDLDVFIKYIESIDPEYVSIGADSKGMHLKEPSKEKIEKLIQEIKKLTKIKIKRNLNRLLNSTKADS